MSIGLSTPSAMPSFRCFPLVPFVFGILPHFIPLRNILRHVLGGFAQALTPCNLPDSFVKQVFSGVVSIWCARWFANHNI